MSGPVEKQPYTLPRNPTESSRLDAQHYVYTQAFGYTLHPTIASNLSSDALIADVGTGTGKWMTEAASLFPQHAFTGLDMSEAQFTKSLPSNCTFGILNILEPIPPKFRGKFDVVHMRLLILGLTGDDWYLAAANVLKLLKPGGHIQWCESLFENIDVLQEVPGGSRAAFEEIIHFVVDAMQQQKKITGHGMYLGKVVKDAGFEDVMDDVVSSDRAPETRREGTRVEYEVLLTVARKLVGAGGRNEEDIEALCERCRVELEEGKTYIRWNIKTVVGRKPMR